MLSCYKRSSEENLSIKKYDRHRNPVYMCRNCRRVSYKKSVVKDLSDRLEWNLRAEESYRRIINKYEPSKTNLQTP